MRYSTLLGVVALATIGSLPAETAAQGRTRTDQEKIRDAMSAAPAPIAQNATIKDWPASEGGEMKVLRQGSNGWVCLPTPPKSQGREAMCLDQAWQDWGAAYAGKTQPQIRQTGYAYMLSTDSETSNTDPYAAGKTADNHWHHVGPHVMVVYPDARMYEGIPTDPASGGPYVMWKGTPYVHVMFPIR